MRKMDLSALHFAVVTSILMWVATTALAFGVVTRPSSSRSASVGLQMSSTAVNGGAPMLHSILKKPSKVLTVGLEYSGDSLSSNEISILSMQLRKCKVSAIWSKKVESIKEFASEQETAKGNFPGPCPVIFSGPLDQAESALSAGASAVVVSADDEISFEGEVIWKVSSSSDVEAVLGKTNGEANAFLVDPTSEEAIAAVPPKALSIASVQPMQPDGAEVKEGKLCKGLGCGSILVREALVGDSEDLEYAQFLVAGLTSKASSEFKFSGLTGSTNGHFGGVQANSSGKWRRQSS